MTNQITLDVAKIAMCAVETVLRKLRPVLPTTRNWSNNTWMPSVLTGRLLQVQKTP